MGKRNGLTSSQQKFCEEFVCNGYNATKAYLASHNTNNYDTANNAAPKMLKNDKIMEYIKKLQQEQFKKACITPERVAMKLAEIAFSEKGDEYYSSTAQLKALDLLQKQLGLQQQKIDANVNSTIINVEVSDDEE